MNSSPPDYHKEFTLTRPLANEFLAMSTTELGEDIQTVSDLCARMRDTGADVGYLEWYLDQAVSEWERRRERHERHSRDPFPPTWPPSTYYEEMRAQAEDIKAYVSIEQYLAGQVSSIELRPVGRRLKGLCPYPDHQEETPSFVIFEDGHAWCFGCDRGGNLFRIIGLMEGLPRFRDQLRRAAEMVPGASETPLQHCSFPSVLYRDLGRKEQTIVNHAGFQPIRIVNGRVVT